MENRVIAWFSCGAASAVATKLAIAESKHPVEVLYCHVKEEHPLCIYCLKQDKLTPTQEVDHIVPHLGDKDLFWDEKNLQALCKPCHSAKTAREDGGFANRTRLSTNE
jgi:5-methylcytosine-specific restriction endonuclease McrA